MSLIFSLISGFFLIFTFLYLLFLTLALVSPAGLSKLAKKAYSRQQALVIFGVAALIAFGLSSLFGFLAGRYSPGSNAPEPTPTRATTPTAGQTLGEGTHNQARVTRVVDGDTIAIIQDGQEYTVRLIGIDTPETKDPRRPVGCYGQEAAQKTRDLLLNREVVLEKDVSETDRFQRLLRYVYINGVMVNQQLVEEGYAKAVSYPPDIKYQDQLRQAEESAREQGRGLWSVCPLTQVSPEIQASASAEFACDCSKPCSKMASCQEAQFQLSTCGCQERDGDNDGTACNSLCRQ